MPAPKTPGTPGPDAVEALASPLYARFLDAALREAEAALRASYTTDGHALSPTQSMTLDGLTSLGAQLVTATTPAGGTS